jgi:hypothetical protein
MHHFRGTASFVRSSDRDRGDVEESRSELRQQLDQARLQLLIVQGFKIRQKVQR